MKKKVTKPKAKVNDVFLHTNEKKMFIVTERLSQPKGNLYTFKELGPKDEVTYKRCYESDLKEKYEKLKNVKAAQVLYGKKK